MAKKRRFKTIVNIEPPELVPELDRLQKESGENMGVFFGRCLAHALPLIRKEEAQKRTIPDLLEMIDEMRREIQTLRSDVRSLKAQLAASKPDYSMWPTIANPPVAENAFRVNRRRKPTAQRADYSMWHTIIDAPVAGSA